MTPARLGAPLALLFTSVLGTVAQASAAIDRTDPVAMVFRVPGVSFEELLSTDEMQALARSGGAGLLSYQAVLPTLLRSPGPPTPAKGPYQEFQLRPGGRLGDLDAVAAEIERIVTASPQQRVLVIVVSLLPSVEMTAAKDELHPIVVAQGAPVDLFPDEGDLGSLTSNSTRRDGVVVDADVRPTVLRFLGEQVPEGEAGVGSLIEIVAGSPPFELHERYLAQRRMYVPIGTAAALYVTGAGLAALALLGLGRKAPVLGQRAEGWAVLSVPMLAMGLLAAGHLPELSYATAVPMVAIVTAFGTMAFSPLERRDLTLVPAGIGVAVLAYFVVEAILGWTGMLTPLLGGSQLDGGRFYGLPNVAIGLLVGSALWVAQRLPAPGGFALLCGLGLFAGLPFVGANLGGAVTSFAAAGLWLAVREREGLGVWKGLAVFAAVTAVGSALTLVAHAISPIQTHVTRFEQNVEGIGGVLEEFADRLQVGFDLIARSPAALVPVLGLPVVLYVVLRPPGPIRETFERWPAWRDALLVTILAGIIAYVVNDSGPAAAGLAFGLGLGGMLGVSLLASPGKMGGP